MLADVATHVHEWWGPVLAFAAGVVSFASPCVLPLVPGYLSFVTAGRGELGGGRQPILPIVLFILGFGTVFTLLGVFAGTALYRWLKSATGERVAGVIVLAFGGFMLLYAFRARIPWLYREGRPLLSRVKPGGVGAFPLGMAFAIGWTPCIGPVLGAIFTLAGAQGGAAHGGFLLFVYSLGLGIPFFLIGIGMGRLMGGLRVFSRYYQWFAGIGGAVMMVIGVLLVAGVWTRLVAPLFRFANRLNLPI
ncbi:MAG: cytochrome C biogenesis protein [Actinobacteria bacterium]|nr:MAG: cytochrome C biogenesis protein [Actinomycetota bacterium]